MTDVDSDVVEGDLADGDLADRDAVAGILAGDGSALVRSDRPDEVALVLVDALDADFVDTVDGVAELIASRAAAARARAEREAADAVTEARAAAHAAWTVVAELTATQPAPPPPRPAGDVAEPDDAGEHSGVVRRSAPLVVAAAAVGAAGLAAGVPLAVLAPVVALAWVAVVARRHRADLADRRVAGEHLAAVSAYADRAYGGVDLHETEELAIARRHLTAARARLRDAEQAWAAVDRPDVDGATAPAPPGPLVVLDEDGVIGDDEFARWTAGLTGDDRVVLVAAGTS